MKNSSLTLLIHLLLIFTYASSLPSREEAIATHLAVSEGARCVLETGHALDACLREAVRENYTTSQCESCLSASTSCSFAAGTARLCSRLQEVVIPEEPCNNSLTAFDCQTCLYNMIGGDHGIVQHVILPDQCTGLPTYSPSDCQQSCFRQPSRQSCRDCFQRLADCQEASTAEIDSACGGIPDEQTCAECARGCSLYMRMEDCLACVNSTCSDCDSAFSVCHWTLQLESPPRTSFARGPCLHYHSTQPQSCRHAWYLGQRESGPVMIYPDEGPGMLVYCDQETNGGGYMSFLRRVQGEELFDRAWVDYKFGFGNVSGDHWLGNEMFYRLHQRFGVEAMIEMRDVVGSNLVMEWASATISDEESGYVLGFGTERLKSPYSTTLFRDQRFSTRDRDQDTAVNSSCAVLYRSGWWFTRCHLGLLTGTYQPGYWQMLSYLVNADGRWGTFHGVAYAAILLREVDVDTFDPRIAGLPSLSKRCEVGRLRWQKTGDGDVVFNTASISLAQDHLFVDVDARHLDRLDPWCARRDSTFAAYEPGLSSHPLVTVAGLHARVGEHVVLYNVSSAVELGSSILWKTPWSEPSQPLSVILTSTHLLVQRNATRDWIACGVGEGGSASWTLDSMELTIIWATEVVLIAAIADTEEEDSIGDGMSKMVQIDTGSGVVQVLTVEGEELWCESSSLLYPKRGWTFMEGGGRFFFTCNSSFFSLSTFGRAAFVRAVEDMESGISAIALDMNARSLCLSSSSVNVACYQIDSDELLSSWTVATPAVLSVIQHHSASRLLLGESAGDIFAWHLDTGELAWAYTSGSPSVSLLPDRHGRYVYAVDEHGSTSLSAICAQCDYEDYEVNWVYSTDDYSCSTPVLVDDVMFVGSYDKQIHAVNVTTGHRLWRKLLDGMIFYSPVVAQRMLTVGSDNGTVYGLSLGQDLAIPPGTSWTRYLGNKITGSWAVHGGRVYVGTSLSNGGAMVVTALDLFNGSTVWERNDGYIAGLTPPTIVADYVVFSLASSSPSLMAFNRETGSVAWSALPVSTSWNVGEAGLWEDLIIVAVGSDATITALSAATGEVMWEQQIVCFVHADKRVYGDRLYVGCDSGYLYALDAPTGRILWQFVMYFRIRGSIAEYRDLVLVPGFGCLFVLDRFTGRELYSLTLCDQWEIQSRPVISNGQVIMYCDDQFFSLSLSHALFPSASPSVTPSVSPTPSRTPSPSVSPSVTPSVTLSPTPSPSASGKSRAWTCFGVLLKTWTDLQ